MEQKDKTIGLLSIARKAGKLQTGEDAVGVMMAEHRARLIVLASDAGAATVRRVKAQTEGTRRRWLVIDLDKQTLGAALGKASVAVAAFADVSLALAFVRTLEDPDPELVADLEKRVERVKSRAESGKRSKLRKS